VAELLAAARRRVHTVWVDEAAKPSPIVERIVQLARGSGVPLRRVDGPRLGGQARTEAPQGVLAQADALPEADVDDLFRGAEGAEPFLLALDGITDPQNLGALLRTAEGAGVTGVLLPRHRAARVTPAAAKAAAGAIEWVPMTTVPGIPSALARAGHAGLVVVGLDPGSDDSLFRLSVEGRGVIVVMGAEGTGLSPLARRRCERLVSIPLRGRLPSLNVAAAGALAMFEVARQRPSASAGGGRR
jgi:23S rRNA (guanosine2251-2'-O)-methyltransferase